MRTKSKIVLVLLLGELGWLLAPYFDDALIESGYARVKSVAGALWVALQNNPNLSNASCETLAAQISPALGLAVSENTETSCQFVLPDCPGWKILYDVKAHHLQVIAQDEHHG